MRYLIHLLFGVLGVWMTFKKAEMEKTLRNGLNLSEMDPINNKWLDFAILLGLALHQFQNKTAVSIRMASDEGFFKYGKDIYITVK